MTLTNTPLTVLIFWYLAIIPTFLAAQYPVIEDLEIKLQGVKSDTARINTLNQLSYENFMVDLEKTEYYGKIALEQAQEINYQYGISQAYNNLAIVTALQGEYAKSIELDKKSIAIAKALNAPLILANAYLNSGSSYAELDLTDRALKSYYLALELSLQYDYDWLISFVYENLSYIHEELGDDKTAREYLQKTISVASASEHYMIQFVPDLIQAQQFVEEEKYEAAEAAYYRALKKSYGYFQRSDVLSGLAELYEFQERFDEAVQKLSEALEIARNNGDKENIASINLQYASMCIANQQYSNAIDLIDKIKADTSIETSLILNKYLLEDRIIANLALGNNDAANTDFATYIDLQDSLFSKEKFIAISEVETKYKIAEREKKYEFLSAQQQQNEILLAEQQLNVWYLRALVLLVSILAGFLYWSFHRKRTFNDELQKRVQLQTKKLQLSNQQLKESNIELERFAFIASHDLKTPLRTIISFTNLLERKLANNPSQQIQEYLAFIKNAGIRMNTLIIDVLEYSKLSKVEKELQVQVFNLDELLEDVLTPLTAYIQEQNATVVIENELPSIQAHRSSFIVLMQNLIENGIKYNQNKQPIINISTIKKDNEFVILFADNGIGIAREFYDKIFVMFARLQHYGAYEGSGLGLANCKKIVEQLNGRIEVKSEVGVGSTFKVILPKTIVVSSKHSNLLHTSN